MVNVPDVAGVKEHPLISSHARNQIVDGEKRLHGMDSVTNVKITLFLTFLMTVQNQSALIDKLSARAELASNAQITMFTLMTGEHASKFTVKGMK